jgi:hypothetical protein
MKTILTAAIIPVVLGLAVCIPRAVAEESTAPRPARLRLTRAGAVLEVEGEAPRRFTSIEEVVRTASGTRGEFAIEEAETGAEAVLEPTAGKKGAKARIEQGEIPVVELARFLADATGLPVIHDSNDAAIAERKITIAAPIEAASVEVVKRLLEVNRIRVREERVERRLTLRLESMSEDGGLVEPSPHPIVVSGQGPREPARKEGARDRHGAPARAAKGPEVGQIAYHGMVLAPIPEALEAQLPKDEDRGVLIDSVGDDPAGGAPGRPQALRRGDSRGTREGPVPRRAGEGAGCGPPGRERSAARPPEGGDEDPSLRGAREVTTPSPAIIWGLSRLPASEPSKKILGGRPESKQPFDRPPRGRLRGARGNLDRVSGPQGVAISWQ